MVARQYPYKNWYYPKTGVAAVDDEPSHWVVGGFLGQLNGYWTGYLSRWVPLADLQQHPAAVAERMLPLIKLAPPWLFQLRLK